MKTLAAPIALVALPLLVGAFTVAAPATARLAGGDAATAAGPQMFVTFKCSTCHAIASQGIEAKVKSDKMKGPDLSDVGSKHDAAWITGWLRHEQEQHGKKHKGQFKGSDEELKQLVAWLGTLKKG